MASQKRKRIARPVIIVFPYLFIHEAEGIKVGNDLHIKPSYNKNVDSEDPTIKEHLLNIVRCFRYPGDKFSPNWSYCIKNIETKEEWDLLKNEVDKFATILRFKKVSDLRSHQAKFNHFNYFIFEILPYARLNENMYSYSGWLNGVSQFNFHINFEKVSLPYTAQDLYQPEAIVSKSLENDVYFDAFYTYGSFLFRERDESETNRESIKILRSMEWFNRSFAHEGTGLNLSEAILNIHTAFEALLRPVDEDRAIGAQIKTALLSLLGHKKELSNWFSSFHKLRNSIIHGDVILPPFRYIHPETQDKEGFRHHLTIARTVFSKCLEITLKIRGQFPLLGLEDDLVPNSLRIKKALKVLSNTPTLKKCYGLKELYHIRNLQNDDISGEKRDIIKIGNILLKFAKEDLLKSNLTENKKKAVSIVDKILLYKGKDSKLGVLYSELSTIYRDTYDIDISNKLLFRSSVAAFTDFAYWKLMVF